MPQPVFSQYGPDGKTVLDPNALPYKPVLILAQSNCPVANAPTGSVAANGALTLGTAFPMTIPQIFLYFPAGAVYAGSPAGFYYCVMSSTTVGTIYNNLMGAIPLIPNTLTPIVAAGPGAYTGVITTLNMFTCSVPGGVLVSNGQLRINEEFSYNLTAGNKVVTRNYAGNSLIASTRTNTGGHDSITNRIRGIAPNRFSYYPQSDASSVGSTGQNVYTVDMTQDQLFILQGSVATATDYLILQSLSIELLQAP